MNLKVRLYFEDDQNGSFMGIGLLWLLEGIKEQGSIRKAAQDMDLELTQSWMIGDGLTDVRAGKEAGTRTILLGRMKCELCKLMDEEDARPDAICSNLLDAIAVIRNMV